MPASPFTPDIAPPLAVATVVTADERLRIDAAGQGLYRAVHRESVDDVMRDLRRTPPAAILLSPQRCLGTELVRIARMVREFPAVPAVAVVGGLAAPSPRTLLALGRSGVRAVVDVRTPDGWKELRSLLTSERSRGIERRALAVIVEDVPGACEDCRRFFELIFRAGRMTTIRALCRQLDVVPSTFMSRFFRCRLPAPKRYLAMARLVHAASLFENVGLSIASVANHLEYSSPQSFGRHVRSMLGMTAQQFRDRYDGEGMLERFRADLIRPYAATLAHFEPLG